MNCFSRCAIFVAALGLAGCASLSPRLTALSDFPSGIFRDCAECPEMVAIPAGAFLMGSPADELDKWEGGREDPRHPVRIPYAFSIGRFEVTRGEFGRFQWETKRVMAACAHYSQQTWIHDPARNWQAPGFAQDNEHPVVCISWDDAIAYTNWLSKKSGKRYRLPSEAEWEYAARAGATGARNWGERIDEGCAYANIGDASLKREQGVEAFVTCDDGQVFTAPVGSYRPNAFGLYDVLGNAWEWTADCWNLGYAGAPDDGSARLAGDCSMRVPRGASWNSHKNNVRLANRGNYQAAIGFYHIGFRVVRER
ncbi:MAG: formylglycine-generating enzyme family protein [Burkholderiales bacterium]